MKYLIFLFSAVTLLGCKSSQSLPKAEKTSILFHSVRAFGAFNIYSVNADGTSLAAITADTTWSYHPERSPGGKAVIYMGAHDGKIIRVARNLNSSEVKPHLPGFMEEELLSYSPDGRKVAYHNKVGKHLQIFTADADGENQRQLTDTQGGNSHPHWSPDGQQMVFRSMRDGNSEIYRMNANGDSQIRLTRSDSLDRYARWSPAGDRIAFASKRDGNGLEIYTMDTEGKNLRRLTDNEVEDSELDWSPDGRFLVFKSRDEAGNDDLYIIAADGKGLRRLTTHEAYDGYPRWSYW